MARASYRKALEWIAVQDDNEWLDDEFGHTSVTAALVADLFDKTDEQVKEDLRKALKREASKEFKRVRELRKAAEKHG
jgi:hypothetical protein